MIVIFPNLTINGTQYQKTVRKNNWKILQPRSSTSAGLSEDAPRSPSPVWGIPLLSPAGAAWKQRSKWNDTRDKITKYGKGKRREKHSSASQIIIFPQNRQQFPHDFHTRPPKQYSLQRLSSPQIPGSPNSACRNKQVRSIGDGTRGMKRLRMQHDTEFLQEYDGTLTRKPQKCNTEVATKYRLNTG